jgi:arsenate reductase
MIQIYHNGRCGKSREGLDLIEKSGKEFEIIKYLENPLSKEQLLGLLQKLKMKPIDIVRQNEDIWKEKFKNQDLSDDAILDALATFPILLERPIVVNGSKAVIGRPPENILKII